MLQLEVCMIISRNCSQIQAYPIRIIWYNMIGHAADGAAPFPLQTSIQDLFILTCVCHSFHLCASYVCSKLPRSIEDLTRDVYNYFQSPKLASALKVFQEFMSIKPRKLWHPSPTRFLSLHSVVKRLLEQLQALKRFFTRAELEDRLLQHNQFF